MNSNKNEPGQKFEINSLQSKLNMDLIKSTQKGKYQNTANRIRKKNVNFSQIRDMDENSGVKRRI